MDESRLIFFTGAPGSKWSAVSEVLTHTKLLEFDISDRNEDRVYSHGEKFNSVQHLGTYFGPGMEFGENWDKLHTIPKNEILLEIEQAFELDTGGYRIIKCHQFVNNLDYIAETFPTSKIIIVHRPVPSCMKGWFGSGGFDITYPNYAPYYKNDDIAEYYIRLECEQAQEWIAKKGLKSYNVNQEHWEKYWGINAGEPQSYLDNYIKSIEGYLYHFNNKPSYDTFISYYGFDNV